MQQLTEMDCNFLQQESVYTPMHISPVIVYDQSHRAGGRVRFKEILTVFERNLHKSAIFRRKLAGGAMGLDTPYWVEDPNFSLEFHVRHLALPKPGDWRQFCILLSRLQARGLDMRRPLWEAYVIEGLSGVEGLPENSFAIMLKIHHAAIDGVSGAEILTAIHSLGDEIAPPQVDDPWQGEREPSTWQVWSRAYLHNLQRPLKFLETVGHLVPAVIRARRQGAAGDAAKRKPLAARTRFNARVSSTRVTDSLILDLEDIKSIRKAFDNAVTVNDIVVTIVGGALQRYLASKQEPPEDSLSCGAPISTRAERDSDATGNQVSLMVIDMATDIADPISRLQAVHANAEYSKAYSNTLGSSVMVELSEILIPQVLGWGFQAVMLAATRSHVPIPFHTIISNVPGPQFPLYLAGAQVHLMMGVGPLVHMMGLFHAVISGAGKITINFVSCREMLPDPQFYRECLEESFTELQNAVKAQMADAEKASTGKKRGTGRKGKAKPRSRSPATRAGRRPAPARSAAKRKQ